MQKRIILLVRSEIVSAFEKSEEWRVGWMYKSKLSSSLVFVFFVVFVVSCRNFETFDD